MAKKPTTKARVQYSPALAEAVCDCIAGGGRLMWFAGGKGTSAGNTCKPCQNLEGDPPCRGHDRPTRKSIYQWLATHEEFRIVWDAAQRVRADYFVEEMVDIADTDTDPSRARVRIETRRWIASKLNANAYGDKQTVEHTGKDGGAINVQLSETERKARILTLLTEALGRAKKEGGADGGD